MLDLSHRWRLVVLEEIVLQVSEPLVLIDIHRLLKHELLVGLGTALQVVLLLEIQHLFLLLHR